MNNEETPGKVVHLSLTPEFIGKLILSGRLKEVIEVNLDSLLKYVRGAREDLLFLIECAGLRKAYLLASSGYVAPYLVLESGAELRGEEAINYLRRLRKFRAYVYEVKGMSLREEEPDRADTGFSGMLLPGLVFERKIGELPSGALIYAGRIGGDRVSLIVKRMLDEGFIGGVFRVSAARHFDPEVLEVNLPRELINELFRYREVLLDVKGASFLSDGNLGGFVVVCEYLGDSLATLSEILEEGVGVHNLDLNSIIRKLAGVTAYLHLIGYARSPLNPRDVIVDLGTGAVRLVSINSAVSGEPPRLRECLLNLRCLRYLDPLALFLSMGWDPSRLTTYSVGAIAAELLGGRTVTALRSYLTLVLGRELRLLEEEELKRLSNLLKEFLPLGVEELISSPALKEVLSKGPVPPEILGKLLHYRLEKLDEKALSTIEDEGIRKVLKRALTLDAMSRYKDPIDFYLDVKKLFS